MEDLSKDNSVKKIKLVITREVDGKEIEQVVEMQNFDGPPTLYMSMRRDVAQIYNGNNLVSLEPGDTHYNLFVSATTKSQQVQKSEPISPEEYFRKHPSK